MSESLGEGWLLQLDEETRVAIGVREMTYLLPEEPRSHVVPRSPPHARRVLLWEDQLVPLVDVRMYLKGAPIAAEHKRVGIVAFSAPGPGGASQTELAALLMSRTPTRVQVSDKQACALPDEPANWRSIAASCFRHPQHGPVPILDLPALLTRA